VDYATHVGAVERETTALTVALDGPLDLRVPSCPDWTVLELAQHVGEFTGFWTHVLCEATGRPKPSCPDIPSGDAAPVAEWYEQLAGQLIGELRATPPDTTVWTWVPDDKSARFAARRCAHELAIHRFDVELARGQPEPIEPAMASDGIEEIFVMARAHPAPSGRGSGETLHLHGTDHGDEWLIALTPQELQVERRCARADLTLRGAVSDLELLLYQRPTLGDVERIGDLATLEAWGRAFVFG
jgi:uncharacterized protein (TIGR03083 family)